MKPKLKSGRKTIVQPRKPEPQGLLNRLDNYFSGKRKFWFLACCGLCFLFSILLFDVKISNANDDAWYVEGAFKLTKDIRNLYAANAPLYALILSVPISILGVKIILLKSLSLIFMLLQIVFLYKAFKTRISDAVLFLVLLTISVNSYFLYFASMTFTEALFLCVQALMIFYLSKNYETLSSTTSLKQTWRKWLILGFLIFLLTITKNIAMLAVAAMVLFFLVDRKFLQAVYATVSFLIFRVPFQLLGNSLAGQSQYASQSSIIMQVDPYNPAKGMETFNGYVGRLFENGSHYLSRRFFQILGFQSEDSLKINGPVAVFLVLIFLVGLIFIMRNKNKILLFSGIYSAVLLAGTFTALQVQWDQPRFVMVYVPLILLTIYSGWYYIFRKSSIGQFFLLVTALIILGTGAVTMLAKAEKNFNTLTKNLSGDIYYGYTPDWINYLKMSEYCADSLPPNSLVAARKASMSFIYAKGKPFYAVFTVFSADPDSILTSFKENHVTHIIAASLRRNPKRNDGYIINTMQRLMYPIMQKYPQKLEFVKQIGESEPAYLYKINY
jgi:hypothetical protein